jgi:hypothetical protein
MAGRQDFSYKHFCNLPSVLTGRSTLPALAHVSSDEDSPTASSTPGTHQSLFDPSSFFRPGTDNDEACGRATNRCVFGCQERRPPVPPLG